MTTENSASKSPLDKALREKLGEAMRQTMKSRPKIAEELGGKVRQKITLQQLNEWSAPTGGRRFPAFLVGPFCEVVGNDLLQRFIMSRQLLNKVRLGELTREINGLLGKCGHKRGRIPRTRKA